MLIKQVLQENREKLKELLSKIQDQVETCLNGMDILQQEEMVLQKYQFQIDANKDLSTKSRYHLSKRLLFDQVPLPPTVSNAITLATIPVTMTRSGSVKPWMAVVRRLLAVNDAKRNVLGNSTKKAVKDTKLNIRQTHSYDDLKRKFYEASKGNLLPPSSLRAMQVPLRKHKHSYRC